MKMRRSNLLRAGRLAALRRSTFNCWRSATTSASSDLLDRKRSRSIHLSRFKSSNTRRSSPDSDPQAKRDGICDSDRHLRHVLRAYQQYYNGTRTHLALGKDSPLTRSVPAVGRILSLPVLGGFHHRYVRI